MGGVHDSRMTKHAATVQPWAVTPPPPPPHCALNPAVQELTATSMVSATPLLGLQHLHKLKLTMCDSPASELKRLSAIESLQCVDLSFNMPGATAAAAPALSHLPVRALHVDGASKHKYAKRNSAVRKALCCCCSGLTGRLSCSAHSSRLHAALSRPVCCHR